MITSRLVVLEILRGVNSTSKLLTVRLGNQCHQVCMLAYDVQDVFKSTQMPNGTCMKLSSRCTQQALPAHTAAGQTCSLVQELICLWP